MVSLPRFFHTSRTDYNGSASPSIPPAIANSPTNEMARPSGISLPVLGTPGSLKTVFGSSDPRDSSTADDFIDEILPEYLQGSLLASNATMGRRSRLDESAGEGLRRNVLVRNAMLSSLERERRQLSEDMSTAAPAVAIQQSGPASAFDEEAQFFEDLLLELSGSDSFDSGNSMLEASIQESTARVSTKDSPECAGEEEEDFVELDSTLPSEALLAHMISSPYTDSVEPAPRDEVADSAAPAIVGSCSSTFSAPLDGIDSGFAEVASCPPSAASCCVGYPNVWGDAPLSPVTSPAHSAYAEYASFRESLSPEASRPTSPISSASSKEDGDGPSPLLLPSDMGPLPSLAEFSLQLPAVSGSNLLTRPSRALAGPWFEQKQDALGPTSGNTDHMHWIISSALHSRSTSVASSSTTISNHQPHRSLVDSHRGGYPFVATNDLSDPSIVVHWSR
ncbi:hypothetical protein [Sporisorium scitamineum]|uniref:Uncharacterized protein n=1 Tax=Sporisorium scitamineum TaxID=49012 RepID=A0A0F7RZ69_9BASI|nr:hypothetical protein [Sporisorium scitamineum]